MYNSLLPKKNYVSYNLMRKLKLYNFMICTCKYPVLNLLVKIFTLHHETTDYYTARTKCEHLNQTLAMPKSQEIQEKMMRDIQAEIQDIQSGIEYVWMGMNDLDNNDRVFHWDDGSDLTWTNWHRGQPNNWRGDQDCNSFRITRNWKWNDVACDKVHLIYVCEIGE